MKRKNGFTLIELLAVIVILAIIALIATPTILGVIDTAKKGAAKSSALGYIDAVEKTVAISRVENDSDSIIPNGLNYISDLKDSGVSIKGEKPSDDSWVYLKNGQVTNYSLKVGDYIINYDSNSKETVVVPKEEGEIREKICYLSADNNRNGISDIGDQITCGTESFYVVSNDGENIRMLSKYNLYLGSTVDSSWKVTDLPDPTGIQSNKAIGYVLTGAPYVAVTSFSSDAQKGENYNSYVGSIVENYVNQYATYLNETYNLDISGSLITKSDLDSLGCKGEPEYTCNTSSYDWTHSTSYWTGTSTTSEVGVWAVYAHGPYCGYGYQEKYGFGVRPLITIATSTVE